MRPWTTSTRPLPRGRRATRPTVAAMRSLVQRAVARPDVIQVAHDLVRHLPARSPHEDFRVVFDAVASWLRYTLDPAGPTDGVELVKAPWVALEEVRETGRFVGDCDDATTLIAALLGALGYPANFQLFRADRRRRGEYSHIAAAAWDGERWVTLDPVPPGFAAGDRVPDRALFGRIGTYAAARPASRSPPTTCRSSDMYRCTDGRPSSGMGYAGILAAAGGAGGGTQQQAAQAQSSGGAWYDPIVGAAEELLPIAIEYGKTKVREKYGRGGGRRRDQIARPLPPATPVTSVRPPQVGFFQKVTPRGVETDWTKVALVGGGALAAGYFFLRR